LKAEYKTENVIVVVLDGPRISETWKDPYHTFIPFQSALRQQGVLLSNFRNNGKTWTVPGHTALTTGHYQWINNDGSQLPEHPSIFQVWRKTHNQPQSKAWLICSKDKLDVLSNTVNYNWLNKYRPSSNCGVNGDGVGSGYRDDSTTLAIALEVLEQDKPNLTVINFKDPDYSGHTGDWLMYLNAISRTDEFVQRIWGYIQSSEHYKEKTTLFITSDHGRHIDASGGFAGHGDNCEGCRSISLLAIGPDFKKGVTIETPYEQIDLAATIGNILNFEMPHEVGVDIKELYR
jgi:arylsulfatase A-like enzyme